MFRFALAPRLFGCLLGTLLLAVLVALWTTLSVSAQAEIAPAVVLTDSQGEYSLSQYIEILRDPTRNLTIQDVSSPTFSNRFVLNRQDSPSLGFTTDAVWVRFRVENRVSRSTAWVLALHELRTGTVELYLPNADASFQVKQTGRNFAFSTRDVPNRAFVFRLDVPTDQVQVLYVRLTSISPITIPLKIWSTRALSEHDQSEMLLYGLFYGAMMMMAAYNLFLAVSLGDKSYLFLALFIITYSLNHSQRDGLGQQYLFANIGNRYIGEISGVLFGLFFILYSITLLDTRKRVPRIHRVLIVIAIAFPLWFISLFFLSTNALASLLFLTSYIFLGLAGFLVWQQGYGPARLYLLGWLLFFVVAFLFFLNNLYPFIGDFINDKPFLAAVAFGALFSSLALADRVNLLQSDMKAANRDLTASERKYRSLFDQSRDGIFISSREGEILDVNPTLLDMFGMVRADLIHKNVADLYAEPAERANIVREIEKRGFVQDYPLDLRRVDGSMMAALLSVADWNDEATGQSGLQGVVRDVTEQKRVEEQLAEERNERERAVVEERNRLARDLHDSVTQSLYSIGLYANAAVRSPQGKRDAGAEQIKEIVQLALEALVDMRSLIFELRPPVLVELGLATAIKTRLQAVEGRSDIAVEFRSSGKDGLLPPQVQTELYRIAQEVINNVVKHSHAEHVAVALDYGAERATLEIRDDGDGFDMAKAQEKNTMGLRSISERAQKINGVLTFEGKPGQGTLVRIEVPYDGYTN